MAGPMLRRLRALCRTLLRRMAPEHKFATAARLCSEVLSELCGRRAVAGHCAGGPAGRAAHPGLQGRQGKGPPGACSPRAPSLSFSAARHLPPSYAVRIPPRTCVPASGVVPGTVTATHEWSN